MDFLPYFFFDFVIFSYCFVLLAVVIILYKAKYKKGSSAIFQKKMKLTVLVAARNEQLNIQACLRAILSQVTDFELIVVDDHSEDRTVEIVNAIRETDNRLKLIQLEKGIEGKKNAIEAGVLNAEGDIILVTDADCLVGENWLNSMASCFCSEEVVMVCGRVRYRDGGSFFEKWQKLEFAAIMAFTEALFIIKKPSLCNGANLAFLKRAFSEVKGFEGNKGRASGDDIFLLEKFKSKYGVGSLIFNNSEKALVESFAIKSPFAFLSQRKRWATKTAGIKNPYLIFLSIIVLSVNFTLLAQFYLLYSEEDLQKPLALILLKISADFLFFTFLGFNPIKWLFLCLIGQLFNVLYITTTALSALFPHYNWKGRLLK
jgi:poly-beta-1,6-N-acetyl-D-glucosamine synthase